jgi:hypothetical protein
MLSAMALWRRQGWKAYMALPLLTILLLWPIVAPAQLQFSEKEGVFYLRERGGGMRGGFYYHGSTISYRQGKKLLLDNPDSGPLMQKSPA